MHVCMYACMLQRRTQYIETNAIEVEVVVAVVRAFVTETVFHVMVVVVVAVSQYQSQK
jgi:hypothetical protein